MKIYSDPLRQHEANYTLYENKTYFLDFETVTAERIKEEIHKSKLIEFIDWQPGNQYAKLTITNYIGNLFFFGRNFDLKSPKFLLHLSGKEQFHYILSDIQNRSKNLTFSYQSPSISIRDTDFSSLNADLLIQFNYFKQIILDWPRHKNLYSDFQKILNKQHFKYQSFYTNADVAKAKKITNKTVQKLVSKSNNLALLPPRSKLRALPISNFLSTNSNISYFPKQLHIKHHKLVIDTDENRFIKFFFEHIQNITMKLKNIKNLPTSFLDDQKKVLSFCHQILSHPFFKEIKKLSYIPKNSTILFTRSGYKEIFTHYTKSRFNIKSILDDFEEELLSQNLKKISDLYEYWVFFMIAEKFLGKTIIVEQQSSILASGKIEYAIRFKTKNISVYYNKTESIKKKTSYSLTLRPDTTVEIRSEQKQIKLIFDAKYKVQSSNSDDGITRYVQAEDIYKMHTYLDAISNVQFSMVVYPGTEFYFYEKNADYTVKKTYNNINKFSGVGAIPLIPSDLQSEKQLSDFIEKIKLLYKINEL